MKWLTLIIGLLLAGYSIYQMYLLKKKFESGEIRHYDYSRQMKKRMILLIIAVAIIGFIA